ncbi:thiol-disulfide oxidoreductase ResA [Bacillus fonticola]|uniref:thiol-disulfide oxidoreductase ResA n=1 Tax=Bacillus fonticola TaxID=2728853 RepID=UPI0014753744|nr:thiol-disulfide oxidoreductase ResA [Bacillus fonticola]
MAEKKKGRFFMRLAILLMMASAVGYTLYANATKEDRGVLSVGDEAPDFILEDMEGNTVQLSDYKGEKGVFLTFWGTWCDPCKREMPYIENQYNFYKDQGLEVLAVNVGESDFAINQFKKQIKMSFPILVDDSGDVQRAYGISPLPTTILISPEGIILEIIISEMSEEKVKDSVQKILPSA